MADLGLSAGQVVLAEYDQAWPGFYAVAESELRKALGVEALDIQHIGSTSVPGLPAKPIIDIAIKLADVASLHRCIVALAQIGYTHKGEYGLPGRQFFVRGDPATHHVHLVGRGSEHWGRWIAFRDQLRRDARWRDDYARHKADLAANHAFNRSAYTAGKTPFVERVLHQPPAGDFQTCTIHAPDGTATMTFVPELGATACSLIVHGPEGPRELLYVHSHFWNRASQDTRGGWPFLFPVCGRVEADGELGVYSLDGMPHRMPLHGFAMRLPWTVEQPSPQEAVFRLVDSSGTRAAYPFAFDLSLTYRMESRGVVCVMQVRNLGDAVLPYYAGFHPYFMTALPGQGKERTLLEINPKARYAYNARFTDLAGTRAPPALPLAVTDPDLNGMLFELGEDKSCALRHPDGLKLELKASDAFAFVQLYAIPEQPFVCVEPWMAPPNAINTGRFLHTIPPGGAERAELVVRASWAAG